MNPRRDVTTLPAATHRLTQRGVEKDAPVTLDSTNTDSGSTPASRFRAGNVVILRTSTLRYVEANDTNADSMAAATVRSAEAPDADWQSATITVSADGQAVIIVTLGATDDTVAEVVTALNADAIFAANFIAADAGAGDEVDITALEGGAGKFILVESSLATAFGAAGTTGIGTDPDVRVMEEVVDLVDRDNVAINESGVASFVGDYDESVLINLTDEAKAVLLRRGASFS